MMVKIFIWILSLVIGVILEILKHLVLLPVCLLWGVGMGLTRTRRM